MLFRFASSIPRRSSQRLSLSRVRLLSSNAGDASSPDLRARLLTELKDAMKSKDTLASTTIRSVLSEVYSADKGMNGQKIASSVIASLIRKACTRRLDSAAQFIQASRPDLAGKEEREADYLARFLPPLLPEAEIDRVLRDVILEQAPQSKADPRKSLGMVFKAFYTRVDKASVDPELVKRRAGVLLST
ncbi:Yqey-like protein-domain-containing protein [Gloeopeniophorella convolvens]|nr:Yqey-like protein-domain-containing protein [Gloeopeniophorella convolvens]